MQNNEVLVNEFGQPIGYALPDWQPRPKPAKQPLEGQYCRLVPLEPELHAQELFTAFCLNNQGETWTYLPYGPFASLAEFKTWLLAAAEKTFFYTIIDKTDNSAQGLASYFTIVPEHGSIEVGALHYSKALQRSRISTEAMYLMMKYAFEDLGYRRYEWKCNALNAASRAAAERLGFTFESIFRQMYVFKSCNRDTAWYSILDNEWPALKKRFIAWLAPTNFDAQGKQKKKLSEA